MVVRNRNNTSYEAKRRKAMRTPTPPLKATLWGRGQARSAGQMVVMRNISAGGVLVASNAPFEAGSHVRCAFKLPGGEAYTLGGSVVRCEADKSAAGTFDVAVAFTYSQSNEAQLVRWVFSWIALQASIVEKPDRRTTSDT